MGHDYEEMIINSKTKVEFYGKKDELLPNTEEVSDTTLCLPLHQSLKFEDVDRVIKTIESFSQKDE